MLAVQLMATAAPRWVLGPALLVLGTLIVGLWIRYEMHRGFFHPRVVGDPIAAREVLPAPIEEVWFSAAGGPRLHGWWLPATESSGAVVFLHGNAGSIRERARIEIAGQLRGLGHSVLIFDYRGYGGSEGKPTHAGVLQDARAATQFAAAQPGVERVVLYGRSLGGALAICAADASPEVAGVITEGAFSSAHGIVEHHAGSLMGRPLASFLTRLLFSSPIEPLDCASREGAPVLLLHSEMDRVVPVAMAGELREALGRRLESSCTVQGEGHDAALATGELLPLTRRFLEAHLLAEGKGEPPAAG